ncbi:winged helix-turn-helix domain-containing protein [Falsiroseomonas oryziterrae]|uniref:winged helix-turn-helix domain-containing protein n=1 Tax=Falsiroseomonas oryziterrae TaxID=2911368 RepID=UPI001F009C68|nr:winged helix-turn-helix domain-containing protein [Roseomonas sp. NPKOSM-4]
MPDGTSPASLPCGRFRLSPARRELRDTEGRLVRLGGRAFDALLALLARQGELVLREELLDAVWGELHVTDDNVTQAMVAIRRALPAEAGLRLRTIHGRGYILDAVEPDAVPAPACASLALTPFACFGGARARRLAAALHEELAVELARRCELHLLATASLGAAPARWLLGGSVQGGASLHLTARLSDADGRVVWADRLPLGAEPDTEAIAGRIVAEVGRRVGA